MIRNTPKLYEFYRKLDTEERLSHDESLRRWIKLRSLTGSSVLKRYFSMDGLV